MQLGVYLKSFGCERASKFDNLRLERDPVTDEFNRVMWEIIKALADKEETAKRAVSSLFYEESWEEMAGYAKIREARDRGVLERFLEWWYRSVAPNVKDMRINVCISKVINGEKLTMSVPVLVQNMDGTLTAYLIRKQNWGKRSAAARRDAFHLDYDPEALFIKLGMAGLLNSDKEVEVVNVYLYNQKDSDELTPFLAETGRPSASANAQFYDYPKLRVPDDGGQEVFSLARTAEMLLKALELEKAKAAEEKNCGMCKYSGMCHKGTFSKLYALSTDTSRQGVRSYKLPNLSEEQLRAVKKLDGPIQVLAGPGSGKTTVLTAHIVELIQNGVEPSRILALTFGRKAAGELVERLESTGLEELPRVSTENSLGYEILRENKAALGFEANLLTDQLDGAFIKAALEGVYVPGMPYRNVSGPNGLIDLFRHYQEKVQKEGREKFIEGQKSSRSKVDREKFCEALERYHELVDAGGYVTYDEQISLCISLFRGHPMILAKYQSAFDYILVDEAQDNSAEANELIEMLAGKHRNLYEVGDDDQSIYRFRGADKSQFQTFAERFPDASRFVLGMNYRSTRQIVSLADAIIKKAGGSRVEKVLLADREGAKVVLKKDASFADLGKTIEELVVSGYGYGDIAVLARDNASLDELQDGLSVPTIKTKVYMHQDAMFLMLYSALNLIQKDEMDGTALYTYLSIMNPDLADALSDGSKPYVDAVIEHTGGHWVSDDEFWLDYVEDPEKPELESFVKSAIAILNDLKYAASQIPHTVSFIEKVCEEIGASTDQSTLKELLETVADRPELASLDAFHEYLAGIYQYAHKERLMTVPADAVNLVTCHDSKGLEYPVVMLWQTEEFAAKDEVEMEEVRNLLYVSLTRAKERLYIYCTNGKVSGESLLPELEAAVGATNMDPRRNRSFRIFNR